MNGIKIPVTVTTECGHRHYLAAWSLDGIAHFQKIATIQWVNGRESGVDVKYDGDLVREIFSTRYMNNVLVWSRVEGRRYFRMKGTTGPWMAGTPIDDLKVVYEGVSGVVRGWSLHCLTGETSPPVRFGGIYESVDGKDDVGNPCDPAKRFGALWSTGKKLHSECFPDWQPALDHLIKQAVGDGDYRLYGHEESQPNG